jgi:hypothetical protein
MASLDIGEISLYRMYLIKQFVLILIASRDEISVGLRFMSGSKLLWIRDRIEFLARAILLESLLQKEYMRYKFYENEFKDLSFVLLLNAHCSFINRYEGRIVVKNTRQTNLFKRRIISRRAKNYIYA